MLSSMGSMFSRMGRFGLTCAGPGSRLAAIDYYRTADVDGPAELVDDQLSKTAKNGRMQ